MLTRTLAWCVVVAGLGLGPELGVRAQTASTPSSTTTVHFEGCLFTEAALTATVPVLPPAGTEQKYVLTGVKVIAGAVPEAEAAKSTYALSKIDQDQVRGFYGKRVGVVGRVGTGTPHPTLEVVSIRDISGGCPVLPGLA